MRFGLLGAVTRGVRRYVIFSELNFVVPTLVKKSGPAQKVDEVETSGQNTAKKHSKTIIYAQLDGKQSSSAQIKKKR